MANAFVTFAPQSLDCSSFNSFAGFGEPVFIDWIANQLERGGQRSDFGPTRFGE